MRVGLIGTGAIARLHRAQGVSKQGPKLSAGRMEQQREWNKAADFYQEVLQKYSTKVVPHLIERPVRIDP